MTASVHDSYWPVRQSVDIPYSHDYDPAQYEHNTPYLCPEELGDACAGSQEEWDIEVQAYEEEWDDEYVNPVFRPPSVFRGQSKPAPNVDYAEANHLYMSESTLAWIQMIQYAAQRVNYNPPKQRMGTTVPVQKEEVPDKDVPQKPKTPMSVPVTKMGVSKRIPFKELPLYKYRGWKEIKQ